jgi:thioredoxin-dependent peroxiredoxin
MKGRLVVLVLLVFIGFFAVRILRAADQTMPAKGQMAPDFTLKSQDGTNITLSQFRGKWVVLYFYPKDMTSGCTIEAHNFQRDIAQYDKLNAVVIGVSVDSPGSHKEFCAKEGLTFKLAADTDKTVVKQYGSLNGVYGMANRNTFLIDPQGKIVQVWTKVDPNVHSAAILAALKMDETPMNDNRVWPTRP